MMIKTAQKRRGSQSQIVYDSIIDLHAQEQIVTRTSIATATGLKLSVIDEAIDKLIDVDESVMRVERGVYAPIRVFGPARAISVTALEDGLIKADIGDHCIDLSPRETRLLATLLAGFATQYSNIQAGRELGEKSAALAGRVKRLERERNVAD